MLLVIIFLSYNLLLLLVLSNSEGNEKPQQDLTDALPLCSAEPKTV